MGRSAEESKTTSVLAQEIATRAQRLSEEAKQAKGGQRVLAALLRLTEQAQVLSGRAKEIQARALRGAEAVTVLASNAQTRHGGIYKAVVDSPLTTPAEREFYQDRQGS